MPIRVDNQGYLLDFNTGQRLGPKQGNDEKSVAERFALIVEEWKKNHPNEGTGPRDGTTIIQVEKGDSQWRIAEIAGANPVTTYTQLNVQYRNPDLIHPDQIVFVAPTTEFVGDPETGRTNVDLFRDNLAGRSDYAEAWESGDRNPLGGGDPRTAVASSADQWDSISRDSKTFLQSLVPYGLDPTLVNNVIAPGEDHAWGAENGYGRQLFLGHYMSMVPDPDARTQQIVDGAFNDTELMSQLGKVRGKDPETLQPTGTGDTVFGPAIIRYSELPDGGDNRGGFQYQFQTQATQITENPSIQSMPISTSEYVPNINVPTDMSYLSWMHLETNAKTYMDSIKDPQKKSELLGALLTDPSATGRSREAAVAGYLQTFGKGTDRNQAAANLVESYPQFKQDIEAASRRVQDA